MLHRTSTWAATSALSIGLSAQVCAGVAVFRGAPGTPGEVVLCDEQGGPPQVVAELTGIQLLSLDFVGRTGLFEFAPDRPRFCADIPGASRLVLQQGRGSLYAFARMTASAPTSYGFFIIDGAGAASVVFELPAVLGGGSPFISRVAVAPDASAMLVATTLAAGGDLYEVDLSRARIVLRTARIPPQRFANTGLALCASWGCAASDVGVLRFARTSSADASFVPFSNGDDPHWFARALVVSENGQWAATIAGASAASEYVYVFGVAGPCLRASDTPDRIAAPGFLPEVRNGPWLAVSDDGERVAWRSELSNSGYGVELFLADLSVVGPLTPTQVTDDAHFEPWIDEIGQFVFTLGGSLVFAAGDPSATTATRMWRADLFQVELNAGGLQAHNLTATSGQSVPPFLDYGTLAPECALWSPSEQAFLVYTHDGSVGELVTATVGQAGTSTIIQELDSLVLLGARSSEVVVTYSEVDTPFERRIDGLTAGTGEHTEEIAEFEASTAIHTSVVRADGALAVVNAHGDNRYLWRVRPDLEPERMTQRSLAFGPCVAFAPSGAVVTTVGSAGAPSLFIVWPEQGAPRRLIDAQWIGCLLPGT